MPSESENSIVLDTPNAHEKNDQTIHKNQSKSRQHDHTIIKTTQTNASTSMANSTATSENGSNAITKAKDETDITLTPKTSREVEPVSPVTAGASKNPTRKSLIGINLKHRFKLIEHLGDGGMSQVYKARDLRLEAAGIDNPFIAIKILSNEFADHPEALKIMARECQKTRELSHPNIVKVFDYDTDNDINFITMELLDGETLDKVIQRTKPRGLAMSGVMSIIEPLCLALDYAHKQGVVHADLKPSNIFLTRSGEVKIFDFGVVRAISKNQDIYSANTKNTEENPKTGGYTPAYASLEMLNGADADVRDDLYALGCIIYELMSSRHPYNRTPANQIEQQQVSLNKLAKVSGAKWKAIKSLLSLERDARPNSALTFLAQMQREQLKRPLITAACAAFIGIVGYYAYDYQLSYETINSAHQSTLRQSNQILALQSGPREKIIEQFNALTTLDQVNQMAFLHQFRKDIIDYYIADIQSKKVSESDSFPDFVQQLKRLDEIQNIYGDSHQLENKRQDIVTSRTHLLQAKEYKFNNLLRQQQYLASSDGEDIYTLLRNMRQMLPSYQPKIDKEAITLYGESVNEAIKLQNYARVESLLDTGKSIFPNHPDYLNLVGKGDEYHQAARTLLSYQESLSSESPLAFPHRQASIFYASLIQELQSQVASADESNSIEDIFNEVIQWSEKLPTSFRPLDDVRKQLSSTYISKANKLIKQGKVRSAKPLFENAEKLLSYN